MQSLLHHSSFKEIPNYQESARYESVSFATFGEEGPWLMIHSCLLLCLFCLEINLDELTERIETEHGSLG